MSQTRIAGGPEVMNCRTFEESWNELLDAEPATDAARFPGTERLRRVELELARHAALCPTCGAAHERYATLRRAIVAWSLRPRAELVPPPGLVERILDSRPSGTIPFGFSAGLDRSSLGVVGARRRHPGRVLNLGLAGAGTLGLILIMWLGTGVREASIPSAGPGGRPPDQRATRNGPDLEGALAEATAATWELARTASEPAARLGRGLFQSSSFVSHPVLGPVPEGSPAIPDSPAVELDPESLIAPALIQNLGDRILSGVRPWSTTARQALGFMQPPSLTSPRNRQRPTPSRGA